VAETPPTVSPTAATSEGAPRSVPIRLAIPKRHGLARRRNEPITLGVPFPSGVCADADAVSLEDGHGTVVPLQVRPLDRWPDGSLRWALLDFQATIESTSDVFALHIRPQRRHAVPAGGMQSRQNDDTIDVDTGRARFTFSRRGTVLLREIGVNGNSIIAPARTGFSVRSDRGECRVQFDDVSIEEAGAIRIVVLARARVLEAGQTLAELDVRAHMFARSPTLRFAVTIRNPRAARHPGGIWQLGDPGSIHLRDVSFRIGLDPQIEPREWWCSESPDQAGESVSTPFEIYQESSGGDEWNHVNHRGSDGVVPLRWRGYRARSGTSERRGDRATPIVGVRTPSGTLAATLPLFWQNFPKALEGSADALVLRLFPEQSATLHELQGGEQKTHCFYVAFDADDVSTTPLDWCRAPLQVGLPPSWYSDSDAIPYLVTRGECPPDEHDGLIDVAIDPEQGFAARREVIDEFGWRNYGDLYADHEAALMPGPPIVSHYNNQYDAVAGFAAQFMRTGKFQWWELMDDLARHVADIDIYHTDADRPGYNGGLFWHTFHYVDAGLSSHRSYPKAPNVCGGGPSNEHNYATGLMLHHFMTGDPVSRAAAISLARWVVAMDDGDRTPFRWLSRGPTGWASQTNSPDYHGPGRGAAHSIRALLDGHRLTGDRALLDKADELIRRVIHPDDDIAARNLLDRERRWSYTAFLQALAVYLDYTAAHPSRAATAAYARASLLHYARWMAEHEFPYLDKPEDLEYPTETWAAQDLRKADVFCFAALYSAGAERDRYLERAQFFVDRSLASLRVSATKHLARPVVLLLSNGTLLRALKAGRGCEPRALPPVGDVGLPQHFVPQKAIAKSRLRWLAILGLTVSAAAAAAALVLL
jgi:hypothetical protein